MSDATIALITEMGASLLSLVAKGTASAVNAKIQALRTEKNAEIIRTKYDEIVNQLLLEREEAVRIAQVYKSELDRLQISDEDMAHLQKTVGRILEILKAMTPVAPPEGVEQIRDLISVDTLKTMQLLGFNYKAAIGEPLTQICANAILSMSKSESRNAHGPRQNRR